MRCRPKNPILGPGQRGRPDTDLRFPQSHPRRLRLLLYGCRLLTSIQLAYRPQRQCRREPSCGAQRCHSHSCRPPQTPAWENSGRTECVENTACLRQAAASNLSEEEIHASLQKIQIPAVYAELSGNETPPKVPVRPSRDSSFSAKPVQTKADRYHRCDKYGRSNLPRHPRFPDATDRNL